LRKKPSNQNDGSRKKGRTLSLEDAEDLVSSQGLDRGDTTGVTETDTFNRLFLKEIEMVGKEA
jgi:hypothetical protein